MADKEDKKAEGAGRQSQAGEDGVAAADAPSRAKGARAAKKAAKRREGQGCCRTARASRRRRVRRKSA